MVYRVIGLMSGSSLDGLDLAFAEFKENAGKWEYKILGTECYSYDEAWMLRLKSATSLSSFDYQLLHADYGHYLGKKVNQFITDNQLGFQVALVSSHGHTTFHVPGRMTAQLGEGAAIAAETGLPVVTDLRALDVALGGQGAPIVPIGEKLLLGDFDFFLNLGGIANISAKADPYVAFDICPANRVLNMLANETGKEYDEGGKMASGGRIDEKLLEELNALEYYQLPFPKSLANDFGTDIVFPIVKKSGASIPDALRTFVEHIAIQTRKSIQMITIKGNRKEERKLLATGGGAYNDFLSGRIKDILTEDNIKWTVPEASLISFKEALIMGFMGVLRWRQEFNVLSSVTGAKHDSIGGAIWTGQEA